MNSFSDMFQGDSLDGWNIVPRGLPMYVEGSDEYKEAMKHPGQWTIMDGVVEGRQDPPGCGFGSYLVSEQQYQDFELTFDAKPDWPADTGVYLRSSKDGFKGYQVLVDHRKSGSLAGFYGNSIGGFHAIKWNVDAEYDKDGNAVGIKIEDPKTTLEPITPDKPAMLECGIEGDEFMKLWKWNDWNHYRIVCVGKFPTISVYINDTLVAKMDTNKLPKEKFFADKVLEKGHIAFEVHDNDPGMGKARWGENAACRWRNVKIKEL